MVCLYKTSFESGLWLIVKGSEECPKNPAITINPATPDDPAIAGSAEISSTDVSSATDAKEFNLAKLSFLKRQDEAETLLHNACSVDVRTYIERLESPKEI